MSTIKIKPDGWKVMVRYRDTGKVERSIFCHTEGAADQVSNALKKAIKKSKDKLYVETEERVCKSA
jgi:hypothetical protein